MRLRFYISKNVTDLSVYHFIVPAPPYLVSTVNSKPCSINQSSTLSSAPRTHPSASDSVVFLQHCALYKFTYLLVIIIITYQAFSFASPAMGHWGTCPLDFQLFNFSGHFRAAQTLTLDSTWHVVSYPVKQYCTLRIFCDIVSEVTVWQSYIHVSGVTLK